MAVAYDAFTTATAGTGDFSFTHTPAGTPKGVVVWVVQNVDTSAQVVTVTYGGVNLELVNSVTWGGGDDNGRVDCYFEGVGLPTGAQTVAIDVNGGSNKKPYVVTVTGAADTEVVDYTALGNVYTNPSDTLGLTGRTSFCALAALSGVAAVGSATELSNWTSRNETDLGAQICLCYTYNTIGTADVTAGYTAANDDSTLFAVAVSEVIPAAMDAKRLCINQAVNRAGTY